MKLKKPTLKSIVILTTLMSSVLMFFDFFTLSIPLLASFLKSSSFSISFFNLPSFVEKNVLGIVTGFGSKNLSIALLIMCAIVKYICLVASAWGIYGIIKFFITKKDTKLIFTSQLIIFAMCLLSFLVIITVNVFLYKYAEALSNMMSLEETLELNFLPTIWLAITFVTSLFSVIALIKMPKDS